jgi:suppressor of G2 allele of SKP1
MKAMNKSYQESGGTVLSTNWNEIGKEETPVKPPDGMEFKKWS